MKDVSSSNSSFATVRKDYQEYDFSIVSIISHKDEVSFRKKKKGSAYFGESSDSEKGMKKTVKGKIKIPKEGNGSENKKCDYREEITEIQYIKNISLMKQKNKKGESTFFYRIEGEIIKITESNNDNEMFARTDYEQMDISIDDFNSHTNPISCKDNLQDIIPILMTFSEFLQNFMQITNLIYEQFKKVLKSVDIDTYLVFILQNVRNLNIQSVTKESLKEMILSIRYQELEENIPQYIDFILEQFYLPIANKCPSNIPVYRVLETIIPDLLLVTNDMKKLGKLGDFSIMTEMSEIINKIDNELFLVFNEKELATNNNEEFKTNLINRLFYLLMIQINKFYKKTYPICCNYNKNTLLNYAKEPFVLCYDCKTIICQRCFKLHRAHRYFDFACTIKKKFANIHSSLNRFLNYKKNYGNSFGKISSINIEYAEDHILFCILKGLDSIADDYLIYYIKSRLIHNESGHLTILHFLDVFLLEYLYKSIFFYRNNNHFLEYDLNLKCSEDRNNLFTILLATQGEINNKIDSEGNQRVGNEESNKNDLYNQFTRVRETLRQEQKTKKIQSIIQKIKPKKINLEDFFCVTELERYYNNTKPFYFNQQLNNMNYIDSSLEDFEQIKANYSKLRYQIQKLKSKEKNDLIKALSNSRNFFSKISPGKLDPYFILKEKKARLHNWLSEKLNWIFYRETFAFELKWYHAYNDAEEKCTKVKYIDGMGPLYEYVMCYFDDVMKSASDLGTICFSDKLKDNNAENDA